MNHKNDFCHLFGVLINSYVFRHEPIAIGLNGCYRYDFEYHCKYCFYPFEIYKI